VVATGTVLVLVAVAVGALVSSWQEPHAKLMVLVGVLIGIGLQLGWYAAWRSRGRTTPAISLAAALLGVLSATFVCFGDGWLRAFGAAVLLPYLLGATFVLAASVPRRG
jgi:hypothetical protein